MDHLILQWTLRVHLTVSNQKHNLGGKRRFSAAHCAQTLHNLTAQLLDAMHGSTSSYYSMAIWRMLLRILIPHISSHACVFQGSALRVNLGVTLGVDLETHGCRRGKVWGFLSFSFSIEAQTLKLFKKIFMSLYVIYTQAQYSCLNQ